jgi:hypothetical protein
MKVAFAQAHDKVGVGLIQCDRPIADMDEVVIYRDPFSGHYWVRPIGEFNDGRFEEVPIKDQPNQPPLVPIWNIVGTNNDGTPRYVDMRAHGG